MMRMLLFPYTDKTPTIIEVESYTDAIEKYIEGNTDVAQIHPKYCLIFSTNVYNYHNYQWEYSLGGNFIIAKRINDEYISLETEDVEYIKKNIDKLMAYECDEWKELKEELNKILIHKIE